MQLKPRPAIHMEKQLGFRGAESLGISKAGQTVLARLIVSNMAPACWLCREGFRKGTMASAHLDARHFSFSLYTTGTFQAAALFLEVRRSQSK